MIIEILSDVLKTVVLICGGFAIAIFVLGLLVVSAGFINTMIDRARIWWHLFREFRKNEGINHVWKDKNDVS